MSTPRLGRAPGPARRLRPRAATGMSMPVERPKDFGKTLRRLGQPARDPSGSGSPLW